MLVLNLGLRLLTLGLVTKGPYKNMRRRKEIGKKKTEEEEIKKKNK